MTDRPILFSGPMVRAILEGRKTQTRRPLSPKSGIVAAHGVYRHEDAWMATEYDRRWPLTLPVAPGDRLWVRETWSGDFRVHDLKPRDRTPSIRVWYWADGNPCHGDWECPRPSIHMPRWASRLTLTVTDVRVQRLQDISEEDAIAEGIEFRDFFGCTCWKIYGDQDDTTAPDDPIASFASLWDACYGPGAWDEDPWVATTTFTAHHCNIDLMGESP